MEEGAAKLCRSVEKAVDTEIGVIGLEECVEMVVESFNEFGVGASGFYQICESEPSKEIYRCVRVARGYGEKKEECVETHN